ncbi:MAG: tRNA pseudouridine(38-40) synthase TruA [Clostridiales Family XIII bacterium]|jgi:tRNA pseudouridine38-40 synthase|nr:tRNA pseudouridine(38-40) synthase TruA [Clostridiales Family XIII bacterium]
MRNVLITIGYDGSGFHGWQYQPGVRTVQGVLEDALRQVCGEEIRLHGTSRTDAGVHAFGQTASFTGDFGIPAERIPVAANNLLDDIFIADATEKPEGFHARYDAVGKTYLYRVRAGGMPDIFLRNYRYQLNERLNTHKMEEAAAYFVGTHDFAAFRSAGSIVPETTVRTVYDITLASRPETSAAEIELRVTGSGFLYNMVRIITGTLVEVGLGKKEPEDMPGILDSCERSKAGHTAPPSGLWLEKVYFSEKALKDTLTGESQGVKN